MRLFRDDISGSTTPGFAWTSGTAQVAGTANWLPTGTELRLYSGSPTAGSPVAALTGSLQGGTQPGLANLSSFDTLDVTPLPGSPLLAAGASPALVQPPVFDVPQALRVLPLRGFRRPAGGGAPLVPRPRDEPATPTPTIRAAP